MLNRRPTQNMFKPTLANTDCNFNQTKPFSFTFNSRNPCYSSTPAYCPSEFPHPKMPSLYPNYADGDFKGLESLQSPPPPQPAFDNDSALKWDPKVMLGNLSLLEQKIHLMQDVLHTIINQEGKYPIFPQQEQMVTADLTCIIIQFISAARALLPSKLSALSPNNGYPDDVGDIMGFSNTGPKSTTEPNEDIFKEDNKESDIDEMIRGLSQPVTEVTKPVIDEHDVAYHDDDLDGEDLPPGSYEILQLEKDEILAPHTHFCTICGKGFKRDANLRMHMRGHGDEYKTPAALAKPTKVLSIDPMPIKRYSCPFVGCKRNKEHKKFQPLKTILCVKNHYKRTHCDKTYLCGRCNRKKFSVIADLKTHEKHCGQDKWLCSCGTTFSRKDKLFGHVALFQGHAPALPTDEMKASVAASQLKGNGEMVGMESVNYKFDGSFGSGVHDTKDYDDDGGLFSAMNFDTCEFGGVDDFNRPTFDFSENLLFPSVANDFLQKNCTISSFNNLL